jgi:hypothetical protein
MTATIYVDPGTPKPCIPDEYSKCVAICSIITLVLGLALVITSFIVINYEFTHNNDTIFYLALAGLLVAIFMIVAPIIPCADGAFCRGFCPAKLEDSIIYTYKCAYCDSIIYPKDNTGSLGASSTRVYKEEPACFQEQTETYQELV